MSVLSNFGIRAGQASDQDPLRLNLSNKVFEAAGNISLTAYDYVAAEAAVVVSNQTTNVDFDSDGTPDLANAQVLQLGISGADLFIGAGAKRVPITPVELGASSSDATADDATDVRRTGFEISQADISIAILQPSDTDQVAGDSRQYLALKADVGDATLTGFDNDLRVNASNLKLKLNQAVGEKDTDADPIKAEPLDWSTSLDRTIDPGQLLKLPAIDETGNTKLSLDFDEGLLEASGHLTMNAFGFVSASTQFRFVRKTVPSVRLSSGETLQDASLLVLALGGNDSEFFVGVNGDPNNPGTRGANGVGFAQQGISFAIAIVTPKQVSDAIDTRRYFALKAQLGELDLTLDRFNFSFTVPELGVALNQAWGTDDGTDEGTPATPLNWQTAFGDGQVIDPGKDFVDPLPEDPRAPGSGRTVSSPYLYWRAGPGVWNRRSAIRWPIARIEFQ